MTPITSEYLNLVVPSLSSVKINVSRNLPCRQEWVQVRFPKSKRKRIRKKWAKNRRNYRYEDVEAVWFWIESPPLFGGGSDGYFLTNPLGFKRIEEIMEECAALPRRSAQLASYEGSR
jgi:hypothetical protein